MSPPGFGTSAVDVEEKERYDTTFKAALLRWLPISALSTAKKIPREVEFRGRQYGEEKKWNRNKEKEFILKGKCQKKR